MALDSTNKWLKGLRPDDVVFASTAEMVAAMRAPEYAKDSNYREVVQQCIANMARPSEATAPVDGFVTGRQLSAAMHPKAEARKLEDAAILKEQTLQMFADPRYATSPSYRRSVEDFIRANSAQIESTPGYNLRDVNQTRNAFRVEIGTDGDTTESIREGIRQSKIAAARSAAEEAKADIDRHVNDEIDELNATARPNHDENSLA